MRRIGVFSWLVFALAGRLQADAPRAVPIEAQLVTPLSTYSSKPGTPVAAVVARPLCGQSGEVMPGGATIRGVVKKVRRVGMGLIHETARLELNFNELELPDGRRFPVEARLTGIDNAREQVDRRGVIRGIRSTATLSSRYGSRLAFSVLEQSDDLVPLFILQAVLFRFPDPEISFGSGTELYLDLQTPAALGRLSACPLSARDLTPEEIGSLTHLVAGLPLWSYSKRQRQPMDMVNLVFLGSRDEIERAFAAAGWSGSVPNSVSAGFRAVRAIAEDSAYLDAPLRTLLLDGAEPEMELQKGLNTFAKRHHLRIWKQAGEWHTRPVWASAATRDIGATFSMRPFGFTHRIENDLDFERDKVVRDLTFTGCVDTVALIGRPPAILSRKGGRKGMYSDGQVAVMELNSCREPRRELEANTPETEPPARVRYVRRVTLTARNHFLRNNMVWRAGDALWVGARTLRRWRQRREAARRLVRTRELAISGGPPPAPVGGAR